MLPYLWCRVVWKYLPKARQPYEKTYRFLDLDGWDRFMVYVSCVLYWNGALGFFVAPFLLIGVIRGVGLPILFGWLAALSLSFAGGFLDKRIRVALSRRHSPPNKSVDPGGDSASLN